MTLSALIGLNCPDQPHLGPHSPTLPRIPVSALPQAAAPLLSCACAQFCSWIVVSSLFGDLRPGYLCLPITGLLVGSAATFPSLLAHLKPTGKVPCWWEYCSCWGHLWLPVPLCLWAAWLLYFCDRLSANTQKVSFCAFFQVWYVYFVFNAYWSALSPCSCLTWNNFRWLRGFNYRKYGLFGSATISCGKQLLCLFRLWDWYH